VAEELHLEEAARAFARDPWWFAPPRASARERFELLMDALEAHFRKAEYLVVENPLQDRD
jgi:hypothetical protein